MKQAYIEKKIGPEKLNIIKVANQIIADYESQGYRLTLRQLYYQFVSKNIITNTERSYKNLGNTISDGRLLGLIDWDAIEDRVRVPRKPSQFSGLDALVDAALWSYRLNRWKGQEYYVELWVEKDALAGVLSPIATDFHVTLMVNRGYSSQSAMYESAQRFRRSGADENVLLYLGDHDPSGEDMVRDVEARLNLFGVGNLTVTKVALTMAQVEEHEPPPNPAKMSDSRAAGYVAEHGDQSWEVDALPPNVLSTLIKAGIEQYLDWGKMNAIKRQEEQDKSDLIKAVEKVRKKK